MMGTYEPGRLGVGHTRRANRITAIETINGEEHLVILERDAAGRYREVSLAPVHTLSGRRVDPAVFLG